MDREALDRGIWDNRLSMVRLAASIVRNPQDAEDAVSEAIVRAYTRIEGLREAQRLRPWLLRITARCATDILRAQRREQAFADMERFDAPAPLASQAGGLYEMLLRLPEQTRQVLILHYYEGFKAREIAGILACPLSTVLMRLSRGREQLKKMLEEEEI